MLNSTSFMICDGWSWCQWLMMVINDELWSWNHYWIHTMVVRDPRSLSNHVVCYIQGHCYGSPFNGCGGWSLVLAFGGRGPEPGEPPVKVGAMNGNHQEGCRFSMMTVIVWKYDDIIFDHWACIDHCLTIYNTWWSMIHDDSMSTAINFLGYDRIWYVEWKILPSETMFGQLSDNYSCFQSFWHDGLIFCHCT